MFIHVRNISSTNKKKFEVIFLYIIASFSLNQVSIRESPLLEWHISFHPRRATFLSQIIARENGLSDTNILKYSAMTDTEKIKGVTELFDRSSYICSLTC